MNHTCITIEGGLLAPDFLETIADAEGQKASDFGLTGRRTLVDEVSAIWSDVRSYWDAFQRRLERSGEESRTSVTREQWIIPLLDALGYALTYQRSGVALAGRNYVVSHRTGDTEEDLPVHIEAFDQDLGSRPASGRGTMSPHAMLQDYLNRTEHLWAIVTNGSTLRLLRDSSYFTRPSFIEFDLKQMLEGERLDEFFVFYRLVHRTRLPKTMEDGDGCLLEKYHQLGIEQGGRIRDGLRDAVTNAIIGLGRGFLQHRKNEALRDAVVSGRLTPQQYYQQILYLIYRLLFLMVAEERNLLRCDGELPPAAVEARRFFTLGRLRDLASEPLSAPERFDDLYLNLQALFLSLCKEDFAATLGLPPLNGELFDCGRTSDIGTAYLDNATLLRAIRGMSYFSSREERVQRRVNYGALDVEELGSVYESLLDFQPLLRHDDGRFTFDLGTGTERKTTGSYYTRPELVQELIKSALEPVIADRLEAAKPDQREDALLGLKVCDPACGSGHFLLAAARRIGTELARVRTGVEAPGPSHVRDAVRDVITHCIYGVDKNPLAVDLCKVALWIEGHSGGKPLTFLDHRIRCGDSLVGVFDLAVLEDGIPDAAFDPVSGDDRKFASAIKKRNKEERTGQQGFAFDTAAEVHDLMEERRELEMLHDDTPEDIHRKRAAWERLQRDGGPLWRERMACHLWTAAFFAELTPEAEENRRIPTTADLRRFIDNPDAVDARLRGSVWAVADRNRFFHWPLEFPEVFQQGGFDCILANPPYDVIREGRFLKAQPAAGTGNLYGHFLTSSTQHLRSDGGMGFVVPLSVSCGDDFEPVREVIYGAFGLLKTSHYSIRPAKLFPGVDQRITLLRALHRGRQPCHVHTTRLHRWETGDEDRVIRRAEYADIGVLESGLIPKVAGPTGASVYRKVLAGPSRTRDWLSGSEIQGRVAYYHAIARYWVKAYDYQPYFQREGEAPGFSTNVIQLEFVDQSSADRFVMLINSSLFYYWWMTQGDEFHVLPAECLGFPVPGKDAKWPSDSEVRRLVSNVMQSYKENSQRRRRKFGGRMVDYDEFYPRRSLQEIKAIDDVVAELYGLTPEENAFVKTYDMEFRGDDE